MHSEFLSLSAPHAHALVTAELQKGHIIAAPTDTVYGIMCRYSCSTAIAKLYAIKGRPSDKPIPVLAGQVDQLEYLVKGKLPELATELMESFWPGALTLVLPASDALPPILTAGKATVAVRIPDHEELRSLLEQTGPLAATSANLSGKPEAQTARDVRAQFGEHLRLILSGSRSYSNVASTIVALPAEPNGEPEILRRGHLAEEIHAILFR